MLTPDAVRLPLAEAKAVIGELADILRPYSDRIEIAGSIRRQKPEVHDAEVVIIPAPDLLAMTDAMIESGQAKYALYGETRSKRWGTAYRGIVYKGIQCELYMTTVQSWGYLYWLRTGPGDANKFIMRWLGTRHLNAPIRFQEGSGWYSKNWSYDGKKQKWSAFDRQRLNIHTEEEMFAVLGMKYIVPASRTEAIYKSLTNKREYIWPDYTPYFEEGNRQLAFSDFGVYQFFDDPKISDRLSDRDSIRTAERQYNEWLRSIPLADLKSGRHEPWPGAMQY